MTKPCATCGAALPLLARADARFCSTRCRVAAHRAQAPAELKRRPRWVRYNERKVPLTLAGRAASSTNPSTWASYPAALASKAGVGVGFVLNGDGIVCLDLDHCLVDGMPTPAAARLLARLPQTYIEVSPSGEGLHVWGRGSLPRGFARTVDELSVEAYGSGRYITVTWRTFRPGPLADLSDVLTSL